jgi:hypothetical protein
MQDPIVAGLPEDPKIDAPLPPGSELLGSIVRRFPAMVDVFADSGLDPAEIVAFYDREYASRGWRAQSPAMPPMPGSGFVSSGISAGPQSRRLFCKGEDGPYYQLAVLPEQPRIRLSWHARSQGMFHPCSSQPPDQRMHGPPADVVPRLEGPPGIAIRGGGSGGGGDEWSTYGSALTEMPAAELMEHFVRSVEEQGHELLERGAGDRVAWSRWRMKKKGWDGFLVVAEQRADVRHLMFLAFTEGAIDNMRQWRSFSTGWSSWMIGG